MKSIKQFEKADRLYNQGDFYEALKLFVELSRNGDTSAMDRVGSIYADGEGVKKNISKAIEWYKKSVASGGLISLYNLGLINKDKNDLSEAKKWFKMAWEAGDTEAGVELAKIYLDNDSNKAISYLKKALADDNLILDVKEEAQELLQKIGA